MAARLMGRTPGIITGAAAMLSVEAGPLLLLRWRVLPAELNSHTPLPHCSLPGLVCF